MESQPPAPARGWPSRARLASIALAGALIGIAATLVAVRLHPEAVGTAVLRVDTSPVTGSAGGDAVKVGEQLGPAVGTIVARLSSGSGLGSGFVVARDSSSSYLVTNNHVVQDARDVHVIMPAGRNLPASIVGTDALDDLAVISVRDPSLPSATWGSSAQLKVGQAVIAIGSPLGNEGSLTQGVVSARHRTISAGGGTGEQTETLQDVLQTDASINRGNSGGPLADAGGRVVGVNVAIAGGAANIGFSIPSDLAVRVTQELIHHEKVQHPFLGVAYLTSTGATEDGQPFDGPGVLVRSVSPGTPAARAGFQPKDIIISVDGVVLDNGETLGGVLQGRKVGDSVSFSVRRGGSTLSLSATLVERPNT